MDSNSLFFIYYIGLSFLGGVIGFAVLIYVEKSKSPNEKNPFSLYGGVLITNMFLAIAIAAITSYSDKKQAQKDFKEFLTSNQITIIADGVTLSNTRSLMLVNDLKKTGTLRGSRTGEKIKLELRTDKKNCFVDLEKDRTYHNVFWVFFSPNEKHKKSEIGKVYTEFFN